jgi:hypothetical protein
MIISQTLSLIAFAALASVAPAQTMTSTMFKGIEANGGSVSVSMKNGKTMLSVSSDFKVPNSPAPHWQVVDAQGNTFLLNQFKIAGDKVNRVIVLPKYIRSIKKVQVWCSFAEVNLGEVTFAQPIKVGM